ncbi:MAG: glycosyltransferase [Acidobacteria bacterium]|nr:glycosyltransferase [Acidobacteriota bacterium]MBI3657908.1 glycosyltransferase [Acidobacteriota bacterium]
MMPRVLYVQYTNPAAYPCLEHSSIILAHNKWQVTFLGADTPATVALDFPSHQQIDVHRIAISPKGWRQKLAYLRFGLWVLYWTVRWRPQWIYASDALSCPIALALSFLPGIRVVYHEHDSPSAVKATASHNLKSRSLRCMLWARKRLARKAALCVLPNRRRARSLTTATDRSSTVLCVWNCPRRDEVMAPRASSNPDTLLAFYHGSIVPPRLPITVVHALAMLPSGVRLLVAGYETAGHTGYVKHLEQEARRLGIADRLEFLGPISPRKDLLNQCARADVGLALMPHHSRDMNLRYMVGASNKPFDYMACGLALLVSDIADWRTMYAEPGYGLTCDPEDPSTIAAALHWLLQHPAEMRKMGEAGRQKIIAEWNYDQQFAPVYERMAKGLV